MSWEIDKERMVILMPIKIPNSLPAAKILADENVFVMTETRAMAQDIRPLQILLLNLMPTKIETETQLSRLLGNTPLQVELELIHTSTYKSKNTPNEYMIAFYKTFDDVKNRKFDGLVITGAPIEHLEYDDVKYWDELTQIMEWSKTHVHSTLHICWGALAGLYYHYGIAKYPLEDKIFGVFNHRIESKKTMLTRGFDDVFMAPHSRHTTVHREDIEKVTQLEILASSENAGVYILKTCNGRQVFVMGHSEYDMDTLRKEYVRDLKEGKKINVPSNYFIDDKPENDVIVTWRSHANLLFSNWLNYYVYQSTPYDVNVI